MSRGVPLSVATRDSVAGWDVPLASGESAVSTMSTPAIAAIRLTMSPVPLVMMFAVFAVTYVFSSRFSEVRGRAVSVLIIVAVIVLVVVTGNVSIW